LQFVVPEKIVAREIEEMQKGGGKKDERTGCILLV
jgi:hypothetical protein